MILTWLYVPGHRPDRFVKAVTSGADAVILDLEDAVAASRKAYARAAVAEFLAAPSDVPVYVRVNELTGPDVAADLAAVAGLPGLAGLRLPKVQSPEEVLRAAETGAPELHCLVESALGVESAFAIATAHPSVAGIGLGEADLSADLNVSEEAGLTYARSRIVVAARAAGLAPPAMSAYTNLSELDGLEGLAASCRIGRALGFLGRAAIHPRQLPVIAEAFRPSESEVDKARALLEAMAGAEKRESGTVVLPDGRFADRAMIAAASRTVALAEREAA
ncbi:CoA ester lyase [Actinorhabdospora filicis]|uniref:CoA ester lyase n=1 Tax=Actinorhabdospora filicis TaxID=1785913 RepID=A0A9W6WB23_9ACTN|nr:CoA ester lyase [Actinorhabdospora filicis]GLZ80209.1 CoA ester lyase [Actinorhabdospora filicis]